MRGIACVMASAILGAIVALLSQPSVVEGHATRAVVLMLDEDAPMVECVMYIDDQEWC